MSLLKLIVPALAAAGSAFAASSCSTSGTTTIESAGDATAIASCTTFSGSIAVATGVADDIALDQIKVVKGDLVLQENSKIIRFGAANLETVSGKLSIEDVSQLSVLSFPKLKEADSLTLLNLANLRELEFTEGITKCDHLRIENTRLTSMDGIDLDEVEDIYIANNDMIASISMDVTNITSYITLSFNNAQVNVSFPKLESANNISLRAIGSLDLPALTKINSGDFGVFESASLDSIYAPNLTKIDGALVIEKNKALKNISFDSLTDVGADLRIFNNTKLDDIDGLPKLKNVQAAFDISGNFTKVETPALDYVKGVFNLQSTANIGSICDDFYIPLRNKGKVPKGHFVCEGELEKAQTAGNEPDSSKSSGSDKDGAASGLTIPSISLGLVGLFAVLLL